jgi:pimeloyl-ACP methyl ester carboxylesterase
MEMSDPDVAIGADPTGAREALRLPDGRALAWSRWGSDTARPVLFCTGAGMSGSLGFGLPALPGLGLQLLAIDRPGLGRSSPHPTKTLRTWVDDVAYLVTSRGLHDGLAVGFSQGAPFAFALGGAGLVDAVAVVAGQDEFRAVRHLLHPEVAAMLADAEADPDGFERTIARDATAEWLWSLIMGMSSGQDRELYTGALGRAYRTALEEGFSQGAAGYARDLRLVLGPWPTPPEQVPVPVDLWYGGQDTSPVHSPDLGRSLAARFSRGRRHLLPDEGSSLLWTRGADILAALVRHPGFRSGAR